MARILKYIVCRGAGAAMLLSLILSYGVCAGQPQTSSEAQKRNRQTQREIQKTKSEISKNEAAVADGLSRLAAIECEINDCRKTVSEMSAKVKALDSTIDALGSQISSGESQLAAMRREYIKAVKKMRLAKERHSTLAFIFSAKSFSQGVRRLRYIREFAAWRDKQSQKIIERIAALKSQKAELNAARADKNAALVTSRQAQARMEVQHREQGIVVAQLKQHGAELQAHLAKKQREADALKAQISELIAREEAARAEREAKAKAKAEEAARAEREAKAKAKAEEAARAEREAKTKAKAEKEPKPAAPPVKKEKGVKDDKPRQSSGKDYATARGRKPRGGQDGKTVSPAKPENKTAAAGFAGMKGNLPRPADGQFKIVSRFGCHSLPNLSNVKYDNPGIDAEVSGGASALAVYPGKVSGVYMIPGYRNVVIVSHGEYYTVYGNITTPSVKTGDSVKTGQKLGTLAPDSERGNRTVIHFEVWRNRVKLNPEEWIR